MSDEDIEVEFEAEMASSGEPLKTCPTCGRQTHRKECPGCEIQLSGDQQIDQVMADIDAGKDIDDLDALLRPGKRSNEEFERVIPGEFP